MASIAAFGAGARAARRLLSVASASASPSSVLRAPFRASQFAPRPLAAFGAYVRAGGRQAYAQPPSRPRVRQPCASGGRAGVVPLTFVFLHIISPFVFAGSGARGLFVKVESTPNPDSVKFMPEDREVLPEKFGTGMVRVHRGRRLSRDVIPPFTPLSPQPQRSNFRTLARRRAPNSFVAC
jgi:hypothetical protein